MTHSSASWGRTLKRKKNKTTKQKKTQQSFPRLSSQGTILENKENALPSPQAASLGGSRRCIPAFPSGSFFFRVKNHWTKNKLKSPLSTCVLTKEGTRWSLQWGNKKAKKKKPPKINLFRGKRGERSCRRLPAVRPPRGTNGGEAPPCKHRSLAYNLGL